MTAWILAGFWWIGFVIALDGVRRIRRLPDDDDHGDPAAAQRVSIVVTARNEQERIGTTVRRLVQQTGVDLEIIVVDDRSTDGTAREIDRLCREHPQVRRLRIDDLPQGWLGKNHACHRGAELAGGDWLLFTDADAWMSPDLVARAIRTARAEGADHLCLIPSEKEMSLAARAGLLPFAIPGLAIASWANRDRYCGPIGVGAFNLVRAEAYRQSGGHQAIAMKIIDDGELGQILLRNGARTRVYGAADDLEIYWARDLPGVFGALKKNLFAVVGFRTWVVFAALLLGIGPWTATIAGAWTGATASWFALAGMLAWIVPAAVVAHRTRSGPIAPLLAPLFFPVPALALAWSARSILRDGGVRWRDTFYPLDDLRG